MRCPHCRIEFHDNWEASSFRRHQRLMSARAPSRVMQQGVEVRIDWSWRYRTAECPKCLNEIIEIGRFDQQEQGDTWRMVYPVGASRGPVPQEVPLEIADDYTEACNVLAISAKASAALSRRCLQNILRA